MRLKILYASGYSRSLPKLGHSFVPAITRMQKQRLFARDFEETMASTVEEIRELGKAGWVKYAEIALNGTQIHFYR